MIPSESLNIFYWFVLAIYEQGTEDLPCSFNRGCLHIAERVPSVPVRIRSSVLKSATKTNSNVTFAWQSCMKNELGWTPNLHLLLQGLCTFPLAFGALLLPASWKPRTDKTTWQLSLFFFHEIPCLSFFPFPTFKITMRFLSSRII